MTLLRARRGSEALREEMVDGPLDPRGLDDDVQAAPLLLEHDLRLQTEVRAHALDRRLDLLPPALGRLLVPEVEVAVPPDRVGGDEPETEAHPLEVLGERDLRSFRGARHRLPDARDRGAVVDEGAVAGHLALRIDLT